MVHPEAQETKQSQQEASKDEQELLTNQKYKREAKVEENTGDPKEIQTHCSCVQKRI